MTEKELIAEIERVAATYTRLDNFYRPALVRYCARLVGNEDAEDVVQTVLVKAWTGISRCRDYGNFRAWLLRIARNECNMLLRRWRDTASLDVLAEAISGGGEVGDGLDADDLRARVRRLSPRTRECVEHLADGMTVNETAVAMGVEEGTIRQHRARARRNLMSQTA